TLRFGAILFQIVFIASNIVYNSDELVRDIKIAIVPIDLTKVTPLPQVTMLIFLVTLFIILWKQKEWATHVDKAFLGTTILTSFALHSFDEALSIRICTIFIAILFIIALIQDAYRMAYIDELTKIPGRRALKEELMKLSTTYTIAMLDVD